MGVPIQYGCQSIIGFQFKSSGIRWSYTRNGDELHRTIYKMKVQSRRNGVSDMIHHALLHHWFKMSQHVLKNTDFIIFLEGGGYAFVQIFVKLKGDLLFNNLFTSQKDVLLIKII